MHPNVILVAKRIGRYRFNRRNGILLLIWGLEAALPVPSSPTIPEEREASFRLEWRLREKKHPTIYGGYNPSENDATWVFAPPERVSGCIPKYSDIFRFLERHGDSAKGGFNSESEFIQHDATNGIWFSWLPVTKNKRLRISSPLLFTLEIPPLQSLYCVLFIAVILRHPDQCLPAAFLGAKRKR